MAQSPEPQAFEVDCPHCKKSFTAELMRGGASRHHGFKCPHCRLFVSYERADEQERLEPQGKLRGSDEPPAGGLV